MGRLVHVRLPVIIFAVARYYFTNLIGFDPRPTPLTWLGIGQVTGRWACDKFLLLRPYKCFL